jgi:hypothetical protein
LSASCERDTQLKIWYSDNTATRDALNLSQYYLSTLRLELPVSEENCCQGVVTQACTHEKSRVSLALASLLSESDSDREEHVSPKSLSSFSNAGTKVS